jgi:hypothetical protein
MTALSINDLQRGATYLAKTCQGAVVGEYLGMETPHGDHAILLRHGDGTESIPLRWIRSLGAAAA